MDFVPPDVFGEDSRTLTVETRRMIVIATR